MVETSGMFFISYASDDRPRVRVVWQRLQRDFPDVKFWFDEEDLLPGADWNLEIRKAKDKAHGMILFLSAKSVNKEGYVQREFKWAMERMEEMPEGHAFLFPVKLDPCDMPFRMREWQACDLFDGDEGYNKLKKALLVRLDQIRNKKPGDAGSLPPVPKRRTAFIAPEKFPLQVLEGVYRECTSRNFKRNSGSLPTFELAPEHGAVLILPVDPTDVEYARLVRQIHLFHPDGIVVLGMGETQAGNSRDTGQLVAPSMVHPYDVREVTKNSFREYELAEVAAPYRPNPRLAGMSPLPTEHHKVGAISTRLDLALLRRQIAATDLNVIELEDAGLYSVAAGYTKDWMLLSAVAGPLGSSPRELESAAYIVSQKVMHMLELEK